jgi:hypothetical protein
MSASVWARKAVTKNLDRYLLVDAERVAAERTPLQQTEITRYFDAATRRYVAGEALSEPSDAIGAIILYKESITLFLGALAKAKGQDASPPRGIEPSLEALGDLAGDPPLERRKSLALLRSTFGDDPLELDALPSEELQDVRAAAQEIAAWLRTRVDPRPVIALRRARWLRIVVAAFATLALLVVLASWAFAPKNIARGKITIASSHHPGTPPASGATNGQVEAAYGVHTEAEAEPWVMVDLGRPYSLGEARVYNRGDGWQDEGLPIAFDISIDGSVWKEVDRRTTPYSQAQPWVIKIHAPPVRYVRVRRPVRGVIAISEIEVYQ